MESTLTPESQTQMVLVTLTSNAVAQLRALRVAEEGGDRPLRLYVESGGCSGMQYGMTFDEFREGDALIRIEDVSVVIDAFSATYLKGTQVDYSDALTGGGFKISNPNAKESCGCGKSFQA